MQHWEDRGRTSAKDIELNVWLERVVQDLVTRWENRAPGTVTKFDFTSGPAQKVAMAIAEAHRQGQFPIDLDKVPEVGTHVDTEGEIWTNRGPSVHHLMRQMILFEANRISEDQQLAATLQADRFEDASIEVIPGRIIQGAGYTIDLGPLRKLVSEDGSFRGWLSAHQYAVSERRMLREEQRWKAYVEKHGEPEFNHREPRTIQQERLMEAVQPAWLRALKNLVGF